MKYKDIAKMLDVSPATVSLVVNNKPGISEARRTQILSKIQELNQETLLTEYKDTEVLNIAFLVFHRLDIIDEQPFYTHILENMYDEAMRYNFKMHVLKFGYRDSFEDLKQDLKEKGCKGLVVFATEMDIEDIGILEKLELPIVYLDNSFTSQQVDTISIDNWQGVRAAMTYLSDLGHQKIGYLKSKTPICSFNERYEAYKWMLEQMGLPFKESYTVALDYGELKSYHAMSHYLTENHELPSAFIADNDLLAASAIEALTMNGYRIPEDISVIGFDDRPLCEKAKPQLSTIKVFQESFLGLAFRSLKECIEGHRDYSLKMHVGTKLIERESTGVYQGNLRREL